MAYDYATDMWYGDLYKRALANGDQAYAAELRSKMDANPRPFSQPTVDARANIAGMISGQTLDMGRGANPWMGGAKGVQVNPMGVMRQEQPARGWNMTPGGGGIYSVNPAQPTQPAMPSNILGAVSGSPVEKLATAMTRARTSQPAFSPDAMYNFKNR